MDDYHFTGNGLEFELVTKFVEDNGNAGAGVQREVKWSLTVYVRFNDNAPAIFDMVGGDRERAVQVKRTSATRQCKDDRQPWYLAIRLHAHNYTRDSPT